MQSHTSKYKLNFQDRNHKLFPFPVTLQISPLNSFTYEKYDIR